MIADLQTWSWNGSTWQAYWPLPIWVVGLLAILLVAVAVLSYWKNAPGLGPRFLMIFLRAFSLLMLLAMLSGFALARYETQPAEVVLLLDHSGSMQAPADVSTSAGSDALSRLQQASDILLDDQNVLSLLQESYQVRIEGWNGSIDLNDPQELAEELADLEEYPRSPLGNWLLETVALQAGQRTAAIVLISDGIVTDGKTLQAAADQAAIQQIPLVMVGLGKTEVRLDLAIEDVIHGAWALMGDRVTVQAMVRTTGLKAGQEVEVQLQDESTGEVRDRQTIRVADGESMHAVELTFVADQPKEAMWKVVVVPQATEIERANNERVIRVDIRDQPLKVLLVQDRPSYEFRYLKHLLERVRNQADSSKPLIELTSVLQSGDPEYARQDQTAEILPPVGREALKQMDAVILSDAALSLLGDIFLKQLALAVQEDGVGLIIVAGPRHLPAELKGTPLQSMVPVDLQSVETPRSTQGMKSIRWTPLGKNTSSLRLSESGDVPLPMLSAVWAARQVRPLGKVLWESDDAEALPIVVTQFAGAGQVRLQLTDETFRLQSFDGTGNLHERYWLQAIRELARGKRQASNSPWELEVEGDRFAVGETVPLRAKIQGDPQVVKVLLRSGDHEQMIELDSVGPGEYRAAAVDLPAGSYQAILIEPLIASGAPLEDRFVVDVTPLEKIRLNSDFAAMQVAAERSGGTFLEPNARFAKQLQAAIPALPPVRLQPLPATPLWNHPLVALLLFTSLAAEWILRTNFNPKRLFSKSSA
ncbi:hypothetical protein FF011L_49570 [Roseimaritima multifibrata]|uniref:VWFA domain-containing protein n=1 Tax=Roseimaritima multifibrata TaxID=1930274 RepID=A0A517MMP2_9BACT|nr:VWA domain-containing protein [Roseimaritima multifibrata]QDS96149.1 hypothetical protein FF011L_49570 [Roseimaritima multifibrata]